MKVIGYHRTSTEQQNLDRGIKEIKDFCSKYNINIYKEKVYTDQCTGKSFARPKYQIIKNEVLEKGDILLITELDRLGRNKEDTMRELRYLRDNGIRVMVLEIPTSCIDLSKCESSLSTMLIDTINNILFEVYASIAQVEMEKREKRQKEGIAAKKARGEWSDYGRPHVMKQSDFDAKYKDVMNGKTRPFELMHHLHMSKSSFYRYAADYKRRHISNIVDINKAIDGKEYAYGK